MAQNNTTIPTKSTGQTLTAAEFNELDDAVNNNATDAESRLTTLELQGGLTLVDKTADSNITAVAGEMHVVDMTAFTVSRNWTLPVAASVSTGDKFGLMIKTGDPDYEVNVRTGAAADLLNGVDISSDSKQWELFQDGEVLIITCIDGATGDYIVEYDGRITCSAKLTKTDAQTLANATYDQVEYTSEAWSVGMTTDTSSTYDVTVRRAGKYQVESYTTLEDAGLTFIGTDKMYGEVYIDGATSNQKQMLQVGADSPSSRIAGHYHNAIELTAQQYLSMHVYHVTTAGAPLVAVAAVPNWFEVREII